ncbi:leucine-rich repeat and calponin homology domain-containing protein 2-like isoform X2 [Polyodon spathula]|uniref:leucine-rich repeat and calponin homology domain-containing protein 2-like isoform X2 n=1 Tax=Polyodon spathula TaxID=7913 RepID=UPI001B7DDDAC|nr:leucine-rich repeat and calponin homology domain-containing protein 2-like isoform X2 [Polyodon spathula]
MFSTCSFQNPFPALTDPPPLCWTTLFAHGYCGAPSVINATIISLMKMAAGQSGGGAATALQSHNYSTGPYWNPVNFHHQHHLHTARSLDRALEEAVCSGMLSISGRKLKDFPGMSYDLTDTTQADLSKNRFLEIPPEVCLFAPLESLNLYHNCIKGIPEAIINLQMLTYLNISRNLLSTLPKYLFDLPLKVLVLSNNKLVSIPEEIGKSKDLMELDISCNEIQVLPRQMGKLHSLRELNIRRNSLQVLPEELANLPLVRLDFSCNRITDIPVSYRKLRQLQVIALDNNPMQSPPAQICLKGKVHIFKYLNIQACRIDKKPESLDLPPLGKRIISQPLTDSMEDFYPSKSHGPDSGIGSDNGDKRLSTTEPSDDDTISLHSQVSESTRDQGKADSHYTGIMSDVNKDQEPYDYIDPNTEEDTPLSEPGDMNLNEPFMSCMKELGRVLSKSHRTEENDNGTEEWSTQREQQLAEEEEEEEELKEVIDLRKIAVQLLQQEKQNRRRPLVCRATFSENLIQRRRAAGRAQRFLSQSFSNSSNRQKPSDSNKSVSVEEGSTPASPHSCMSSGSLEDNSKQDQTDSETHPVVVHSQERRRNKYLRKDYIKNKCQTSSRKNSSGNENDREDGIKPAEYSTMLTVFGLKPRTAFTRPSRHDSSSADPGFTMRRKMEHLREEMEQIRQLRHNLESRLKVMLPDDVGAALMDGVVLCHLANHIRPRSVGSIHVPSPAVPKLSMAKCRRNVENFLDACKKLGVPQEKLCLPHHILEERGMVKVGITVQALLELPTSRPTQLSAV